MCGCKIGAKLSSYHAQIDDRTQDVYYIGTIATIAVICYWRLSIPYMLHYCVTARFYKYLTKTPNGELSQGSLLPQGLPAPSSIHATSINITYHPFINYLPFVFDISIPPRDKTVGITIKEFKNHNFPYIQVSTHHSIFQSKMTHDLRHKE